MNNITYSGYAANIYSQQQTWAKKTDKDEKSSKADEKEALSKAKASEKTDSTTKTAKGDVAETVRNVYDMAFAKVENHAKYGATIGDVKLSDKAADYYEQLKKKFGNMDFILVSKDNKDAAQAQAGRFANPNKMVVLIDDEKLEKMATDETYRNQIEGVIANAQTKLTEMQSSLNSTGAKINTFGVQIKDDGTAEYFAVLERSREATEKILEKRAEKKAEAKKEAEKAEKKKEAEEALEEKRAEKSEAEKKLAEDDTRGLDFENNEYVIVRSNDLDMLISKVQEEAFAGKGNILSAAEKNVGQSFDISG